MEIEDVVLNEGEMIEVEDNRREIEEMSDEVLLDDSCFESDMEDDVNETTYIVLNQA